MNASIPVKEALTLISMALADCDKEDAKQTGCKGRHWGSCGEGLHHHHDENCFPDLLARATMRPMLLLVKLELDNEYGPDETVEPAEGLLYPPLAALRDHYDAVRPDWRER